MLRAKVWWFTGRGGSYKACFTHPEALEHIYMYLRLALVYKGIKFALHRLPHFMHYGCTHILTLFFCVYQCTNASLLQKQIVTWIFDFRFWSAGAKLLQKIVYWVFQVGKNPIVSHPDSFHSSAHKLYPYILQKWSVFPYNKNVVEKQVDLHQCLKSRQVSHPFAKEDDWYLITYF